jgi:hypothetical protein
MRLNKVLLIILSLLASVRSQCPSYWWPLTSGSVSIGFLSEVMKGNNISGISGPQTEALFYVGTDRIGNSAGYRIMFTLASNGFVIPPDYYFCNGVFSVTFWILQPVSAAATVADFKDINGNGVTIALTAAGFPTLGINAIAAFLNVATGSVILFFFASSSFLLIVNDEYIPNSCIDNYYENQELFTRDELNFSIFKEKIENIKFNNTNVLNLDIGIINLEKISFYNKNIKEIDPNLFNGLVNLEKIDFSYNLIKEIHQNTFNGLANLKYIGFVSNQLEEIPSNFFNGLAKLEDISFHGNQIKEKKYTLIYSMA